jgi:hypothetical protein
MTFAFVRTDLAPAGGVAKSATVAPLVRTGYFAARKSVDRPADIRAHHDQYHFGLTGGAPTEPVK